MCKKLTTEIFIERSNNVHKSKYDYSFTNYINNDCYVSIKCNKHGIFQQNAKSHLDGHGCPKCKYNFLTTEEFIMKSNFIHKNKYDYSLSVFDNYMKKVKIKCKKHDIFHQSPKVHLNGHGCPKCANNVSTKSEIIIKANQVHNNKYMYNDFDFNNRMSDTIVGIVCPKHGIFYQRLNNHIHQKNGCPTCDESKGESIIEKYFIDNNIIFERQKTFERCLNKKRLRFDFYLKKYNLCVEYDGEQHYQSIYGDERLQNLKINDEIKNKFCAENNIYLLRIKYDENILEKLEILNE